MNEIYIKTADLPKWLFEKHFKNKDLISLEDLICEFENVSDELGCLQDEFENFKQEVNDNYKPISLQEQIGYNENW